MVGMFGLWKMLKTVFCLLVDFNWSLSPSHSQPPLYFSWFSHCVGNPVPGLVSTLFHHMYSVPARSVQRFLQAKLQVWQPMHLSRWKTMETCARTFILPPNLSPTVACLRACGRSRRCRGPKLPDRSR